MANENWEQIEITPEGWRKIAGNKSPVKFKRTPGMLPIAYPDHKGEINVLGEFLNLESEAQFQLIAGWLTWAIQPDGPFPILLLQGEQGSAKSTTATRLGDILQALVEDCNQCRTDARKPAVIRKNHPSADKK
jgi:hypothetical protein